MQSPLPGRHYGDKDWTLDKSSRQPNFLHIMTLFGTDLGDRSWLFPFHRSGKVALVVKSPPTNAGDIREAGSIPGLGRSPGGGNVNPLQYSCLENPMNTRAWQAMVHMVTTSAQDVTRMHN